MRRAFIALALFAIACDGGTKVNIADVKIAFDPACFILDTSTAIPVLKLAPACTGSGGGPSGIDSRNDFVATPGQLTFTTSAAPLTNSLTDVYRNGMMQSTVVGDYTQTVDGTGKVTVTLPSIASGDVVVLRYRR